jgi:hypothetical protein
MFPGKSFLNRLEIFTDNKNVCWTVHGVAASGIFADILSVINNKTDGKEGKR